MKRQLPAFDEAAPEYFTQNQREERNKFRRNNRFSVVYVSSYELSSGYYEFPTGTQINWVFQKTKTRFYENEDAYEHWLDRLNVIFNLLNVSVKYDQSYPAISKQELFFTDQDPRKQLVESLMQATIDIFNAWYKSKIENDMEFGS